MTDGPTSQSYFAENYGRMSIWQGTQQSTVKRPSALIYSSSFEGEDNNFVIPIPQLRTQMKWLQHFLYHH